MMRKVTDKIWDPRLVTLGPLKAKVMTASRTNITLEVTNFMVKEDLVGKPGKIFAAVCS